MTPIQIKIAKRREHQILAEGLSMEICLALGEKEDAHKHLREMDSLIGARQAMLDQIDEEGGCYFATAGELSRIQNEARRAVS